MMKKSLSIILLLFSLTLFSCSTLLPQQYVAENSHGQCLPVFPDKNCWYGGDGAYSIPLDKERVLWVFGDTFASCEGYRKDRVNMDVILGTTVAISTCSADNEFKINYYLKIREEVLYRRLEKTNGCGRRTLLSSITFCMFL